MCRVYPDRQSVVEGSTVQFSCVSDGNLEWLKDGQLVTRDRNLTLVGVDPHTAGLYVCNASTDYDTCTTTASLEVTGITLTVHPLVKSCDR